MNYYLNSGKAASIFSGFVREDYFVDKTLLADELSRLIGKENRYVCITRPRRFGKTANAVMLASFFGKGDSSELFSNLKIARTDCPGKHLNKHNVVFIDFSQGSENCDSYRQYADGVKSRLIHDLKSSFQDREFDDRLSIDVNFMNAGEKFIFIFDEWDAPFRFDFMREKDKRRYMDFLHVLLKGQAYVELAYMTGILPIRKYSSASDLNMFNDCSLINDYEYSTYFGFTDEEVDCLYGKLESRAAPRMGRDELRFWYDGYETAGGGHLYNPRSLAMAMEKNQIRSYWTDSGPAEEIFDLLKMNIDEIQRPVSRMLEGESADVLIDEQNVNKVRISSKEDIFAHMLVYGLLTSDGKNKVRIPNFEIREKFNRVVCAESGLGYISRLAKDSLSVLHATKEMDEKTVAEFIERAHDSESTILTYNRESDLAAILNLVYLAARDYYFVEREARAGKGYADMIFTPFRKSDDCIIIELKIDDTAESAISRIKAKRYADRFAQDKSYSGRILLVGIAYDRKTKRHSVRIVESGRAGA